MKRRFARRSTVAVSSLLLCTSIATAEDPSTTDSWRVIIGANASYKPEYNGANKLSWGVKPLLAATYKNLGFSTGGLGEFGALTNSTNAQGLSLNFRPSENLRVGAALRAEQGRKESDSAALKGMGDTRSTVRGNFYARYNLLEDTQLSIVLAPDLLGRGAGTSLSLGATQLLWAKDNWRLSAGIGFSLANRQLMQAQFGVTASQSNNSGLPQYAPSAGIKDANLGVSLGYRISSSTVLSTRMGTSRLLGDANSSPLVKRADQPSFSIGIAHSFSSK